MLAKHADEAGAWLHGVKVFKYSDETAEAVTSGEKLLKESGTIYESFADMMSPDDAAKYLDFLENGSKEGLTSAELAGVEKADALLVSQKVGYEDVWDLRNVGDALESGNSSIHYGELDSLGRATGVDATITVDMVGTGTPAKSSIKPAGFGGQKAGHARGHLLGNQLGGAGDDPGNLTTLFQNPVNHPVMSSVEGSVRKAVEAGEVVQYSVKPIYEGNTLIPSGVTVKAEGDKGFYIYQTILNRK